MSEDLPPMPASPEWRAMSPFKLAPAVPNWLPPSYPETSPTRPPVVAVTTGSPSHEFKKTTLSSKPKSHQPESSRGPTSPRSASPSCVYTPPPSSPLKGWTSPLKSRRIKNPWSISRSRSPSPSPSPISRSPSPSPSPSPTKRFSRPTIKYGDRYIPNREGIDLGAAHKLLMLQDNSYFSPSVNLPSPSTSPNRRGNDTPQETIPGSPILNVEQQRTWEANRTFNTLLRAELFAEKVPGAAIVDEYVYTPPPSMRSLGHCSGGSQVSLNVDDIASASPASDPRPYTSPTRRRPSLSSSSSSLSLSSTLSMPARPRTPPPLSSSSSDGTGGNLFSFKSPTRKKTTPVESSPKPKRVERETDNSDFDSLDRPPTLYSSSVVRPDSQRLLLSPRRPPRRISNVPFKVLDAPELADDFYLNLVDWGQNNTLAVGLGSAVYLWNAASGQVSKLCDVSEGGGGSGGHMPAHPDRVTSVAWIEHGGNHLAIGCDSGLVQIWDATRFKRVRTMPGHTARVGCLAWRDHILSSGSRDRHIVHRDVRAPVAQVTKWLAHHQEVCGLEWNAAHLASRPTLASGGNDNRLMVWEGIESTQATLAPRMVWEFADNKAAVKALAWHPHQRGILASGGGTADGRIRFWNTSTGRLVTEIATGSQVCNLKWSKTSNELVSTHGYSRNHITVWKYPTLQPVATLTGHTFRVLYLSMSPDGQSIVTGAGDETLRFWQVFGKSRAGAGVLDAFSLR